MNKKFISELGQVTLVLSTIVEQVKEQVKASRMKLCKYIAKKEQCNLNFDKRFSFLSYFTHETIIMRHRLLEIP